MTSKRNLQVAKWFIGSALVMVGSSAMADWNFNKGADVTGSPGINSTTSGGITATATGLSTTGSGISFANATSITSYNGLGLGVQANSADVNTPQHSTDNSGTTDAILLNFGTSVVLTGITSGWSWTGSTAVAAGADSDVSVLRYIGTVTTAAAVNTATLGKTVAQLTAAGGGWELVSQIANLATGISSSTGDTTLGSSWWLVSAYNSGYTSVATTTTNLLNGTLGDGNDYFKLLAVAGVATPSTSKVPEPGSLALVGAGLLGFLASRRKAKGKTAVLAA